MDDMTPEQYADEEFDEQAMQEAYLLLRAENRKAVCKHLGIPVEMVGITLDGKPL